MLKHFSPFFKNKLNFSNNKWFIWNSKNKKFVEINNIKVIPSHLLKGIDYQKEILQKNSIKFANGFKANSALLWGTRGNGKSTLIKSIFKELSNNQKILKLIQVNKNDLKDIIYIYDIIEKLNNYRFVIYIDDLSFEKIDPEYKIIKSILDGNIKEQPDNSVLYVTSNRRHLMPRNMIENERSSAIHTDESVEEKISLSDRFGLWIGFHNLSKNEYIEIIKTYSDYFKINITEKDLQKSLEWSITRGNRNGRTAWQFIIELASDNEIKIKY